MNLTLKSLVNFENIWILESILYQITRLLLPRTQNLPLGSDAIHVVTQFQIPKMKNVTMGTQKTEMDALLYVKQKIYILAGKTSLAYLSAQFAETEFLMKMNNVTMETFEMEMDAAQPAKLSNGIIAQ